MKREEMRHRLLRAAEEVLLTEGARGATVRAITSSANVNLASVTTAFGGRSALLDELFAQLMVPINDDRDRRYQALGVPRSVESVVRAFIEPLGAVSSTSDSAIGSLLRALLLDDDGVDHPLDRVLEDPGVARLTDELQFCLPHLAAEDARMRVDLAVGTIFATATLRSVSASSNHDALDALVQFISAGLQFDLKTPQP